MAPRTGSISWIERTEDLTGVRVHLLSYGIIPREEITLTCRRQSVKPTLARGQIQKVSNCIYQSEADQMLSLLAILWALVSHILLYLTESMKGDIVFILQNF